jgi:hypothetical protein
MPLTKLESAVLVVIDLQKGIVGIPTVHPAGEITLIARPSWHVLSGSEACQSFLST